MVTPVATQPADPLIGALVADKYEIEERLGQGGMGVVYRATHVGLDHCVAIKILRNDLTSEPAVAERFAREARLIARLDSSHVVRVLDAGSHARVGSYIVMEYLEGENLYDRLERTGPLGLAQACCYVLQAIAGLEQAHKKGIVHRDLKPENLFLARTPQGTEVVKVLDFGISKQSGPAPSTLTQSQVLLGSPRYMAPEQILSLPDIDERADLWALGIVLYELTTGEAPFAATSLAELCAQIVNDEPVPPSRFRPELPAEFDALVMQCLRKEPHARTKSVEHLARGLQSCLLTVSNSHKYSGRSGVQPRTQATRESHATMSLASTIGEDAALQGLRTQRLGPFVALAAALGLGAAAIVFWPVDLEQDVSPPTPLAPQPSAQTAPDAPEPVSKIGVPAPSPVQTLEPKTAKSTRVERRVLSAQKPVNQRVRVVAESPRSTAASSERSSLPDFGGRR